MRKLLWTGLVAVWALLPSAASATLYSFRLDLTIEEPLSTCQGPVFIDFGCFKNPGDHWVGKFTLDVDPRTLPDGAYSTPFVSMRLETDGVLWEKCIDWSLCQDGRDRLNMFRNIFDPGIYSAEGPGYYVQDGAIIGIAGGFMGQDKFINFDFAFEPGAGKFVAGNDGGSGSGWNIGSYTITPIPEPSSLALLGAGLLGFLALRRRT
jgi:hypothetical protein